jgi:PEP-CTERM motif
LKRSTLKDPRVRVRHRQPRQHRTRTRTWFLVTLLFAATAVVTWQFSRQQPVAGLSRLPASLPASQGGLPDANSARSMSAESLYVASRPNRPAYPYSVIPGGVGSVEELREIAEHDPVVARHFQGFDYQQAHLVTVSGKQSMYLAYRQGDKVYWTRKKVALHPGETLISDGKIVARTRCGNRVAVAPLGPPALIDPLEADFNQPIFSNDLVTNPVDPQTEAYAGALPSPAPNSLLPTNNRKRMIPFFFLPLAGLPGGGSSSHTPLAVTPEPGTMLLLSSGLVGVYWKSRKARRKR